MRDKVLLVHHHHGEPHDDRITHLLTTRGVAFEHLYTCNGDPLPEDPNAFSAAILFGGSQNTDEMDKYPFLIGETRWIEMCLKHDKPFLGICLGGQMLAHVLGGKVGPLEPVQHEFGFYPVHGEPSGQDIIPETLHVVQAHFHGWEMPAGAEKLAFGDTFPNQAMRYGNSAYGFQFHPEVTQSMFKRWQASDWAPHGKPGAQPRQEQDRDLAAHEPRMGQWFDAFLHRFFALAKTGEHA